MEIGVRVAQHSLRSAFRRLSVRLPDESGATSDFVFFNAKRDSLEMVVGGTFESLEANVVSQDFA